MDTRRFQTIAWAMLLAGSLWFSPLGLAQEPEPDFGGSPGDALDAELPDPDFGGSQADFFDDGDLLSFTPPPPAKDPINLVLPEPFFGGTPLNYQSLNLEKPNYKPRPDFMAPRGTTNIAAGKTVTSSVAAPEFGEFALLVDGDKSHEDSSILGLAPDLQWVQIDFGAPHDLYAMALWHYHQGERVYFDVVIQVADDTAFTNNIRTVFSNDHDNSAGLGMGAEKEYIESYKSKFIDLNGIRASSMRLYSQGNTTDDLNHYVEAEVFGKPSR